MLNLLLIGNGKWGKNYISTFAQFPKIKLTVATKENWQKLINDRPDGVIIVTPPQSHIDIACYALDRDIPVMIEKPLALSYQEAAKLKKYYNLPILINNLHLFAPAFQKICHLLEPTDIVNIRSRGTNIGPIRDYSSLFDYGPHDIAMGLYLMRTVELPIIDFMSQSNVGDGSIFNLNLKYLHQNIITHHITVGNAAPKQRSFEILDSQNNIYLYDDLAKNKLTINNKKYTVEPILPLENTLKHFIKSIEGHQDDRFGIELSLKVLKILENCQSKSIISD